MTQFFDPSKTPQTRVLRAADDLRRGLPVHVTAGTSGLVLFPLEHANTASVKALDSLKGKIDSYMLLTDHRALSLKIGPMGWPVYQIKRDRWITPEDMVAIADPTLDLSTPLKGPFSLIAQEPDLLNEQSVKLLKIARLLPAGLVVILDQDPNTSMTQVNSDDIQAFDIRLSYQLKQVASAKVPLAGSENARLISFRPLSGGVEHIAILVGDPPRSAPVLTRLHSECFTGDLLASLKCDCGEQLKGAIKAMDEAGGGLVLYMAQEGRGIGLTSKLKAYSLQDEGYDTVDANTMLGFDVDERLFLPAAEMIRALGFSAIRLMTNNPEKVKALEEAGLTVSERVTHSFPPNPHNINYLSVKKDRTGHLL